jgi:hypothetical protein
LMEPRVTPLAFSLRTFCGRAPSRKAGKLGLNGPLYTTKTSVQADTP